MTGTLQVPAQTVALTIEINAEFVVLPKRRTVELTRAWTKR